MCADALVVRAPGSRTRLFMLTLDVRRIYLSDAPPLPWAVRRYVAVVACCFNSHTVTDRGSALHNAATRRRIVDTAVFVLHEGTPSHM